MFLRKNGSPSRQVLVLSHGSGLSRQVSLLSFSGKFYNDPDSGGLQLCSMKQYNTFNGSMHPSASI